ncbi:Retrovirus-related Pol polyprotein from transposon, partial [Nosema granulosis]
PDAFIAYVKGWAAVNNANEDGKVFFLRDHLADEAKIWAESIPWDTKFEELCEAFQRRFKGKMSSILHIKTLARTTYEDGSFLSYLDRMRSLASKAGLPEIVLITFVLNGLPDDIGGSLLMNVTGELNWTYIYNACEGLDCSNRPNLHSMKNNIGGTGGMEVCNIRKVERCYYCNLRGHLLKDCRRKKWHEELRRERGMTTRGNENRVPGRGRVREVNLLERDDNEGEIINKDIEEYINVCNIGNVEPRDLKVEVTTNGYKIKALIDTGSMTNLVKNKFITGTLKPTREHLVSANGTPIKVLGRIKMRFKMQDEIFEDDFIVTDDITSDMILGFTFLKKERVQICFGPAINIEWGRAEKKMDKMCEHKIITTCQRPIVCPTYRLSNELEKEASKIIKKYIEEGIVRESSSPWRSPIVLVKKKNGEYRLCVDYRRLNEVTIRDTYPMPRVDDILNEMHGAKYFTKLDALSGYHQVRMHKDDIEKTAFACKEGLFEFTRMPFGLINAPATFQRIMNRILKPFIGKFVMVYMDDIVIYSKTKEEHSRHVKEVIQTVEEFGLTLNKAKCEFGKTEIKVLGHVVNGEGVKIDPDRIEAIKRLEIPKTKKELESFLGMINYCTRFIKNLSDETAYLYGILRKDSNVNWKNITEDSKYVTSVKNLKNKIADTQTLALPNANEKFILVTDASDVGVGAILMQRIDGKEKIISYFSKAHTKHERNYSTTEKELLAVIKATEHFRHHLLAKKFTLRTDHSAIKYLFKSTNMKAKFARWSLYLQEYDMEIEHVKGIENPSDCLSRLAVKEINQEDEREVEQIRILHERLAHGSQKAMEYHLANKNISNVRKKVEKIIEECFICQKMGINYRKRNRIAIKTSHRNEIWEVDIVGPLPKNRDGYLYLLTAVDHFSKIADVRPLRTKDSIEVTNAIKDIIRTRGTPEIIISDNGREFSNQRIKELAESRGINWRFGAPYTPTTTGLVERFNRTFIEKLKRVSEYGRKNWVECIHQALEGYLNTRHRAIGCTPREMLRKDLPQEKQEYRDRYRESYKKEVKNSPDNEINIGDRVLYHHPIKKENKLAPDYDTSGIVRGKSFGSVTLELNNGKIITSSLRNVKKFSFF